MKRVSRVGLHAIAAGLAGQGLVLAVMWGGPLSSLWGMVPLLLGCWVASAAIVVAVLRCVRSFSRPAGTVPSASAASPAAASRRCFLVITVCTAGYLTWGQPYSPLSADLALGAIASVCVFVAGSSWLRLPRSVELICVNVCLLVVLAELGLRALAVITPSPILAASASNVAERIELYRPEVGKLRWGFPCNSLGHYDTEFSRKGDRAPRQRVVATIGDSFAAGIVPHAYHYSTVIERALRPNDVEVYNFGVPAIGPQHYAYLLRFEVLPVEPDLILVHIFVGNDLFDFDVAASGWSRAWLDRDRLLLASVPRRLSIALDEARRRGGVAGELQGEAAGASDYPWLFDYRAEQPSSSRERFVDIERLRARAICTTSAEGLRAVVTTIREMHDHAGSIPLCVVLIPDVFQIEDPLWAELAPSLPAGAERESAQRLLLQALDNAGIRTLDLLPVLRAEPIEQDGSRHLYHAEDTHFNARGNEVAGRAMAEFVRAQLPR